MKTKYKAQSKFFTKEVKNDIIRSLSYDQIQILKASETKNYRIYLQYRDKYNDSYYENINIEGIINAVAIFDLYASKGHSHNLHVISVFDENDKRIKKVKFNYHVDKMKYKMKLS